MSILTVDQVNLDWLKAATLEDLKNGMRNGPEVLAAVNALLQTPEGKAIASDMLNDPDYVPVSQRTPSPEEAAQIATDTALAERQAAEAAAAASAEADAAAVAEAAAAAVLPPAPLPEEKKKIVVEYQATDEDGHPIGRPTHIEGWTWEEVSNKQRDAHINAVRYAERVKSNRVKQSAAALESTERSITAKAASERSTKLAEEAAAEKDPVKMKDAVKLAVEAERDARIADEAARAHGKIIATVWMEDHKDEFLPCEASSKIIQEFLVDNGLVLSYENLDKAFAAKKHQLPKVERQPVAEAVPAASVSNAPAAAAPVVAATPASIPPVAAPSAVTPSEAQPPAPQPAATAPKPTPVAAQNVPPATRRPGVNGSLPPGTMSAARPTAQAAPVETRATLLKEIAKMPREEYRKKLRDPNYVKRLEAAGIPVVSQHSR